MDGSEMAKMRATKLSLANNFVNQLTSLTLRLPKTSTGTGSNQNYKLEAGGRADITYSLVKKSWLPLNNLTATIEDTNACNITLYSDDLGTNYSGERETFSHDGEYFKWDGLRSTYLSAKSVQKN